MSKFSHSSSGTLNNNFVSAVHFVGLQRETISIVNDNEFLNFFFKPAYFSSECNSRRVAYIRKSERDRMNVLKFLKNVKLLFKFRHRVILNTLLC